LFEFGINDFDRYLETFKKEGVKILWESREKNILIIHRTNKINDIIKKLN
jgi:hypothetical protein